jgi:hypothetical protein
MRLLIKKLLGNETKLDKRNKAKEIEVLNTLLTDLKENTHDWTYTGYNYSTMRDINIINDVKNIAIIIPGSAPIRTMADIRIRFHLRDIAKYHETDENTVELSISGKHVTNFLIETEECLDVRGKELDFFNNQIEEKL